MSVFLFIKILMSVSRLLKLFVLKLLWPLTVDCILQVENVTTKVTRDDDVDGYVSGNTGKLLLLRTHIMATMFRIGSLYKMWDING